MLDPDIKKEICDIFDTKINGKLVEIHDEVKENTKKLDELKLVFDSLVFFKGLKKFAFWAAKIVAVLGGAWLIIKRVLPNLLP